MSYLPDVPDMSPAPDAPTISNPSSVSLGKPGGIAAVAHSVGKPGRTQHVGSVVGRRGAGMSTRTGGDPAMHSLGHYGKNSPPGLLAGSPAGGVDVTSHAGSKLVRGSSGGIRSHVREGGIGPGRLATPGPSNTDYSMNNTDPE